MDINIPLRCVCVFEVSASIFVILPARSSWRTVHCSACSAARQQYAAWRCPEEGSGLGCLQAPFSSGKNPHQGRRGAAPGDRRGRSGCSRKAGPRRGRWRRLGGVPSPRPAAAPPRPQSPALSPPPAAQSSALPAETVRQLNAQIVESADCSISAFMHACGRVRTLQTSHPLSQGDMYTGAQPFDTIRWRGVLLSIISHAVRRLRSSGQEATDPRALTAWETPVYRFYRA